MYDQLVPEYSPSEMTLDVKKRKSFHENSEAVKALLSLDVKRAVESKRSRLSHSSDDDARDSSPKTNTSYIEYREDADHESRSDPSDSSPILTRRLIDQDELASALALASLAYSSPKIIEPSKPRVKFIEQKISYKRSPPIPSPDTDYHRFYEGMERSVFHRNRYYPVDQYPYMPYDLMMNTHQRAHIQSPFVKKWKCDYCRVDSFATYADAVQHEKMCSLNPGRYAMELHGSIDVQKSSIVPQNTEYYTCQVEEDESKYFCGIIPLGIPEVDPHSLSEMNCFIRNSCIEVFSANDDDVRKSSKRGRINPKQVGLRCKFCAHVDVESQGMSGVSYPVSSSGIHESAKRWFKIHLPVCNFIPEDVKTKIFQLEKSSSISTRRRYWIDSAKALGIEDTAGGLRFTRDVQDPNNTKIAAKMLESHHKPALPVKKGEQENVSLQRKTCGGYIVFPEDAEVITPYLYALLRQVERCQFTETDRYIARSKCNIGFNGFQCRHCCGHNGMGKYFPLSSKALCTNSTSQNIFSHLQKCSECPDEIKEELKKKRLENQQSKRSSGWRQTFFDDLWRRLHGDETLINV